MENVSEIGGKPRRNPSNYRQLGKELTSWITQTCFPNEGHSGGIYYLLFYGEKNGVSSLKITLNMWNYALNNPGF